MKRSAPMQRGKPLKASGTTKAKKAKRYQAYLRSAAWKAKRLACIEAAGGMCEHVFTATDRWYAEGEWLNWSYRCPATENLTAHHLTYARFGHELPEDLECLCRRCHDRVSALEGRRIA